MQNKISLIDHLLASPFYLFICFGFMLIITMKLSQTFKKKSQCLLCLFRCLTVHQLDTAPKFWKYFPITAHPKCFIPFIKYQSNVWAHLLIYSFFPPFDYFLHDKILLKTTKLCNNTYGIMW